MSTDKFYMAGAEGTGEYLVPVVTGYGRVGYRYLGGDRYRIRVEAANPEAAQALAPSFPRNEAWKQPGDGGQNHFSVIILGGEAELQEVMETAFKALIPGGNVEVNGAAPPWAQTFLFQNSFASPRQSRTTPENGST